MAVTASESMPPKSAGRYKNDAARVDGVQNNLRPYYIQLESYLDFSRLVCALENVPFMCMVHKYEGQDVLCTQVDVLHDKPIMYYVPLSAGPAADHYVYYGLKSGREEYGMSHTTSDASMAYSPVIRVKSLPDALRPDDNISDMYYPVVLEDLSGLTKMTWGREDAPFPLFLFSRGDGKWSIGAVLAQPASIDAPSYFAHVELDADPGKPFLMFSTQNGMTPKFVDAPSEHGYSYMKIIRLKGSHPLIDYEDVRS